MNCVMAATLLIAAAAAAGKGVPVRPADVGYKVCISEFNAEIERAVASGEAWPCSPFLATAKLLGTDLPSGVVFGNVFCRGEVGDSVATVAVRGGEVLRSEGHDWIEYSYHCLADSTWRLVGIDALVPLQDIPPAARLSPFIFPRPPKDAFVVSRKRLDGLPRGDGSIKFSSSANGLTVDLAHLSYGPSQCAVPDSTIPISVYCGPFPDSVPQARIAVLETSDLEMEVMGGRLDGVRVSSIPGVAPGFYQILLSGSAVKPATYQIRVLWHGEPVGESLNAFSGPK
jgi:hypothetical protein